MTAPYQEVVRSLRQAFPQPVSDRVHDAYFVFSFLRALDQVDRMKSVTPLLGKPETLDYAAARQRRVAEAPSSLESVSDELVEHLSGLFISGHPRAQVNVVPAPTIPSIIGGMLPSIYNPNLCSNLIRENKIVRILCKCEWCCFFCLPKLHFVLSLHKPLCPLC